MIPLLEVHDVPEMLYTIDDARRIREIFPHPALLYLEGRHKEPLFVTVLLHGNEDAGLFAIQRILRKYKQRVLPRSLIVFFGNVYAAEQGMRRLEGQPDYNRVWPGGELTDTPEGELMGRVMERVLARGPFASIDIHNNTGKNPHYGCINRLEHDFFYLASLFGRLTVYFETPTGVQSLALANYCPAITVECGKPGVAQGAEHAADFVDSVLHLAAFPEASTHSETELEVYHTVAKVTIPPAYTFSYTDADADIVLDAALEEKNFTMLPRGTSFARIKPGSGARFDVYDEAGNACFDTYFYIENNAIKLNQAVMPSMITRDETVIRQDCLCYLMERMKID